MANETNEIFTKKVKPIHPVKFFFMSLGESLLKLALWAGGFILSLFTSLWSFFVFVGRGAVALVFGIYKFFRRKAHQFKYNDKAGRLSFIFFGSSSKLINLKLWIARRKNLYQTIFLRWANQFNSIVLIIIISKH